jgi:hypothetical protein
MSEANEGAPEGVTEHTAHVSDAENETSGKELTQAQGDEQSGDDAAAAAEPEPKPRKSAQERIDELTRARREAERDVEFWKAKALQTPQQPQPAQAAQEQPQGDGRPDPSQYEGGYQNPDFIEDLTDWKAEQAAERLAQRHQQRTHQQTAVETYQSRTKALFPEGKPAGLVAFERLEVVPVAVNDIVGDSEIGPKLAAHLGDNPAELDRLFRLSPALQARELTRLETRLSEPPKATPKTATDAPEPPPQARGAGGRYTVAPDTDDFAAFEKQYG